MYFALTSLSTTGFGDYHPITSAERLICAFILLIGVSIFAFFQGELFLMMKTVGNITGEARSA